MKNYHKYEIVLYKLKRGPETIEVYTEVYAQNKTVAWVKGFLYLINHPDVPNELENVSLIEGSQVLTQNINDLGEIKI